MTALTRALRDALNVLGRLEIPACLVGGLAVSARTEPRFTRDVDMAVAVIGDAQAEAVVHGFTRAGWSVGSVVEHDSAGRLATARMIRQGGSASVMVDLLFASSGIEPEMVAEAELLTVVPGLEVPTATVGYLIATKLLSVDQRRHQDAQDLEMLFAVATAEDLTQARRAVGTIMARGFGRGRDLMESLDGWLERP